MSIPLVRRPGLPIDLNDPAASRAWVMERVRHQVQARGQARPQVWMLGWDFVETLDLVAVRTRDPGAHLGSTFQALRQRREVQRCYLVLRQPDGERDRAVIFEERQARDGRRWWLGTLGYRTDPLSGLGIPDPRWQHPEGETGDPSRLPAFLREIAAPPPGARPAGLKAAPERWQPDIKFAFGELPEDRPLPADARSLAALAGELSSEVTLTGRLSLVFRLVERSWELWALGDDLPASSDEMIRWIASSRLPAAEGVARLQLTLRPEDSPPTPGVQIVAEQAGVRIERWTPLSSEESRWSEPVPVSSGEGWLGVPSLLELEEDSQC